MPSSAPTGLYTLSLHDALPISRRDRRPGGPRPATRRASWWKPTGRARRATGSRRASLGATRFSLPPMRHLPSTSAGHRRKLSRNRSEEHTSELQSRQYLVCRLLRPPASTLFPYTTLFRSPDATGALVARDPQLAALLGGSQQGEHVGQREAVERALERHASPYLRCAICHLHRQVTAGS